MQVYIIVIQLLYESKYISEEKEKKERKINIDYYYYRLLRKIIIDTNQTEEK